MEDNTGSRESKKKSMEDNTRSSESKEKKRKTRSSESKEKKRKTRSSESKEKRRKSMEDNTRSSESKGKKRKSMEDNTPTAMPPPGWAGSSSPEFRYSSSPHVLFFSPPVDLWQSPNGAEAMPPPGWAVYSSPHVEPDQNIVLVRAKPLGNPTAPMEADEKIIEEDAVCEACSAILREDKNILRRKCKCSRTFIHETCVADGNNCGNCRQKVQTYPVTLVRGLSSSTPVTEKGKKSLRRFLG